MRAGNRGLCPSRISGPETAGLAARLGDPELRNLRLHRSTSSPIPDIGYTVKPGREDFETGAHPGRPVHRPSGRPLGAPSTAALHAAERRRFRRGDGTVRCPATRPGSFSTAPRRRNGRVVSGGCWRNYGFDNAAVLNGGLPEMGARGTRGRDRARARPRPAGSLFHRARGPQS